MAEVDPFQTALANLRVSCDEWPCHEWNNPDKPRKLKELEPGSPEAFYMLATLTFNLYRKFNYQWRALRDIDPALIDRALLDEVREDERELERIKKNAPGDECPYEDLARALEEIVIRQHTRNGPERDRLLGL